uniref:Uncharacterized protein n=1 Tax=Mycena chlorophos TaxID=658473 RepID=A0ABQ0KWX1_MYCCL|nr:predicted protein [Mycena chlorophos]
MQYSHLANGYPADAWVAAGSACLPSASLSTGGLRGRGNHRTPRSPLSARGPHSTDIPRDPQFSRIGSLRVYAPAAEEQRNGIPATPAPEDAPDGSQ